MSSKFPSARRMSYRVPVTVALVGLALASPLLITRFLFIHRGELDFQLEVVNFIVALLPTVASLAIAIWPPSVAKKKRLRAMFVLGGVFYSYMLWHQQSLMVEVAQRQDQHLLAEANEHSDQQISAVKSDVDHRLLGLSNQVYKSQSEITGSISKVVFPTPKHARLRFSLFQSGSTAFPLRTESLIADKGGVLTVNFYVKNVSDTPAESVDVWIYACKICMFVNEPQGFARLKGMPNWARHRMFPILNAGTSLSPITVKIKLQSMFLENPPRSFLIGFRYACATCGKMSTVQTMKVLITPPLFTPKKPKFQ